MIVTKLRAFLFGIIIGQALMLPHIYRWMTFPVISAFPVSDEIYQKVAPCEYRIKNVRTNKQKSVYPMRIHIASVDEIRKKFIEIYGEKYKEDAENLLGFYFFDKTKKEHVVYSPRSVDIVIHEIRHAFEGGYHRTE